MRGRFFRDGGTQDEIAWINKLQLNLGRPVEFSARLKWAREQAMLRIAVASFVLLGMGTLAAAHADQVIGLGVQGRPHGGHTPQRMLYLRHGLKVPYRYRHHPSRYAY